MKLRLMCNKCFGKDNPFVNVEFQDDGVYKVTCNSNHTSVTILQAEKFEILFEMASLALIDGYTREAVSGFAASLERFMEFCIEIMIARAEIDYKDYCTTWNYLASQSERQVGAFYILYLNSFRKPPVKIKPSMIELRNKVIHKGYIPKYEEVVQYGEYLLRYMVDILEELKLKYREELYCVVFRRLERLRNNHGDIDKSTIYFKMVLNVFSDTDYTNVKFADLLVELKTMPEDLKYIIKTDSM